MAMNRADIARMMYVGQKEVFKKTLRKNRKEEWRSYATIMKSDKQEETYDTLGNLHPAQEKTEEGSVNYGKITQAYKTTVKNKTWSNGIKITMETVEDDQYGVVDIAKTEELARTMLQLRERNVATQWNGVFTNTGADGKAFSASDHPLLNSSKVNNNTMTGLITPDNLITGCNMFNSIYNHSGEIFDTEATAILAHKDKQALLLAVLQSNNKALEMTNTKNTVPTLRAIFSRYINTAPWHLIDETIPSVIFQQRKDLTTGYEYDKKDTFNYYFNCHERYQTAIIHCGYGFVSSTGVAG